MDQLEHKQNSSTHQVHRQLYSIKEDLIYDLAVLLADAPDQKQSQLDYDAFETKLREILEPLHTADFADLLELLSNKQRTLLFSFCVNWINPEVLTYLDEQVSEHLFDELDDQTIARFLTHLESDDAIELIGRLNETRQQQLLRVVPAKDRALFQQSLNFPDQSAGRLMRREAVAIPAFWTVGQTIDYLRANAKKLPDVFYNLMIVGSSHKPIGIISASNLLSHDRQKPLARLFERDMLKLIPVLMNQEDVVLLFRQYGLVESPVIDEAGRLIGTITIDDIVNVMDEIHEEDLLKLGGVASDDFYADMFLTLRKRFTWLMINLLTAILASIVIGVFEVELEKAVALAILMPIVASMGGNAATQTMTVSVRALAVNELTAANRLRMIGKELAVGVFNGMLFAACAAFGTWVWFNTFELPIIIAIAMFINLTIAALAGIIVPLLLSRFKIDPAVASTVVVTTITDCIGFFAFLGIATFILF